MLFARFIGRLDWACPNCNYVAKTRIRLATRYIECSRCRSRFVLGTVFYHQSPGPTPPIPRDTLMIQDGFVSRRSINRTFCHSCSVEISNSVLSTNQIHHRDLHPDPVEIPAPEEIFEGETIQFKPLKL